MPGEHIDFTVEDGIATLAINRPHVRNALNYPALDEMIGVLDSLPDKGARVLLLTGRGQAFCAGADLSGGRNLDRATHDAGAGLESHFNPLARKLADLPLPVVSAVNGAAAGGGCGLALMADFVFAARSAYFLQPFMAIGLVPDFGATFLLPRLVGKSRATRMMMLGERIGAETALDWGLIHAVSEDESLMEDALALARHLAAGPTVTYALTRRAIMAAMDGTFEDALARERVSQREAGRTADHFEGVAAFLEKRKPVFRGE